MVLIVSGYFLYRDNNKKAFSNKETDSTEVRSGEIEVKGVISCLPYRVAIAGQKCVKSIKGDDGKDYALESREVGAVENAMPEGTKVTGIGEFETADTSVNDSSVFRYDGVLILRTLKTR